MCIALNGFCFTYIYINLHFTLNFSKPQQNCLMWFLSLYFPFPVDLHQILSYLQCTWQRRLLKLRNMYGKLSITKNLFSTAFSSFLQGACPPLARTTNIRTWKSSHHMSEIFDLFLSKPVVGLIVHTVCYVWFLLRGVWFHILTALNRLKK